MIGLPFKCAQTEVKVHFKLQYQELQVAHIHNYNDILQLVLGRASIYNLYWCK